MARRNVVSRSWFTTAVIVALLIFLWVGGFLDRLHSYFLTGQFAVVKTWDYIGSIQTVGRFQLG